MMVTKKSTKIGAPVDYGHQDGGERKPARKSDISVFFYFTEISVFPAGC
jgi:hypothetical protein